MTRTSIKERCADYAMDTLMRGDVSRGNEILLFIHFIETYEDTNFEQALRMYFGFRPLVIALTNEEDKEDRLEVIRKLEKIC